MTLAELNYLVMRLNGLVPARCRLYRMSFSDPNVEEVWHYALRKVDTGYVLQLKEQYKTTAIKLTNTLTKSEMYQALYAMVSMVERMPIDVFNIYPNPWEY